MEICEIGTAPAELRGVGRVSLACRVYSRMLKVRRTRFETETAWFCALVHSMNQLSLTVALRSRLLLSFSNLF